MKARNRNRAVEAFVVTLLILVGTLAITKVAKAAGGELAYNSNTTAAAAIVSNSEAAPDAALVSVTATTPATPVMVNGGTYISPNAGDAFCNLWVDGTDRGRYLWERLLVAGNFGGGVRVGSMRLTLTAASHTFAIRCSKSATGAVVGIGTGAGNWLQVVDLAASVGGAATLHDLTDVNDTGKIDGSVLKYNPATSKWIVATDTVGAGAGAGDTESTNRLDILIGVVLTAFGFATMTYALGYVRTPLFRGARA